MTNYYCMTFGELKYLDSKEGDVAQVRMRGEFIAIRPPESVDDLVVSIKQEPKRKMTCPSQEIYKPRKK